MADPDPHDPPNNPQPDPNTERELRKAREEAKTYREDRDRYRKERDGFEASMRQAQADAKAAKDAADALEAKTRGDIETGVKQVRDAFGARLVKLQLAIAAIKAGLIDDDDVALIPMDQVQNGRRGQSHKRRGRDREVQRDQAAQVWSAASAAEQQRTARQSAKTATAERRQKASR